MSTVTQIRPNGTVTTAFTTNVGGAGSFHAAVSDNADSTYTLPNNLGNLQLYDLGNTVTLLANERVEQVRYKVRNRVDVIGKYADYIVSWVDQTGTEGDREQVWANDSIGTDTLGWHTERVAGGRWEQDDIDAVQLRVGGVTVSDSSYTYPRFYELYADIQVDTQPFLTGLNITNADSSRPRVNWTFNDDDGDAQARYVAKYFTQAQYTAGGFNPDTSTATWDSGEVSATRKNATPTVDLAQGVTYRAYVKAARDFMGLGYWYSAWSHVEFTTTANVPDSPTLGATADQALNRVALTLQGRVNALSNNAANVETDASGWANVTNSTLSTTTTAGEVFKGGRALTQTATAAGTMTARSASRFQVTEAVPVIALAQQRARTTTRTTRVSIVFFNVSSGGSALRTVSGTATTNSTSFTQRTVTATPLSGETWAEVRLEVTGSAASGEVHIWDAISLAPGSSTFWGGGGWLSTATGIVEASDDAGATWTEIQRNIDLPDASQLVTVHDYAARRGVARSYRAYVQAVPAEGQVITSAASATATATLALPTSGGWWLKDLLNPSKNTEILVTEAMDFTVEEQVGVFRVLGRRGPIVISSALGRYDASVSFLTVGAAQWATAQALLETSGPLLLQAPDGEQWHIRVVDRSVRRLPSPAGNLQRLVTLGYVEIDPVVLGA